MVDTSIPRRTDGAGFRLPLCHRPEIAGLQVAHLQIVVKDRFLPVVCPIAVELMDQGIIPIRQPRQASLVPRLSPCRLQIPCCRIPRGTGSSFHLHTIKPILIGKVCPRM